MEKRTFELTNVEIREADPATGEAPKLRGYAAVFNSDSVNLGGFVERIDPSAFNRTVRSVEQGEANVFALWSHDSRQPLGSTKGGKLKLSLDERGLGFELDVTRFTPAQLDAAKDGELRMSFGFESKVDDWARDAQGTPIRTLIDVDLFEVSPVVQPAYPDTTAALRSLDGWKAAEQPVETPSTEEAEPSPVSEKRKAILAWASNRVHPAK